MRVLFQAPAVLRRWGDKDDHRPAGAWELLHDLALVAALIRVSQAVKDAGINKLSLGMGVVTTSLLFDVQIGLALYTTRFHQPDLLHQAYTFAAITLMVLAAVHLEPFSGDDGEAYFHEALPGFSGSFAAMWLLLGFMYAMVAWFAEEARVMAGAYCVGYILAAVLCVGVAAGHETLTAAWICAALACSSLIGAYGPMLFSFLPRQYMVPVHVAHLAERFALVTLLALGELVVSLVLPDLRFDARHYAFLCLGVLLVFLLFLTYYYGQPFESKHHAMRRSSCAGRAWIICQRINIVGLVGVGIALKSILSHLPIPGNNEGGDNEDGSTEEAKRRARLLAGTGTEEEGGGAQRAEEWMLCICLAMALAAMSLSRMQHRGWEWELGLGQGAGDSESEEEQGKVKAARSGSSPEEWAEAAGQRRVLWACRGLLCVLPIVEGALWGGDGLGLLGLCVVGVLLYVVTDQFDEMRGTSGTQDGQDAFSTAFDFQTRRGSAGPVPDRATMAALKEAGVAGAGGEDGAVPAAVPVVSVGASHGGASAFGGGASDSKQADSGASSEESIDGGEGEGGGECVFGTCLEHRVACERRRAQSALCAPGDKQAAGLRAMGSGQGSRNAIEV